MPSWIYIWDKEGGMPGLLGPYTKFRAERKADKLNEEYLILDTVSSNRRRAKQEMKEQLVDVVGFHKGRRRISNHEIKNREVAYG